MSKELEDLLQPARFAPYLAACHSDVERARKLYAWNTELAGALHRHLSYVEVAMRNAIDAQLRAWYTQQGKGGWIEHLSLEPDLETVVGKAVEQAKVDAKQESQRREPNHPRYRASVTHDDVVAQLTCGSWTRLVKSPNPKARDREQQRLWRVCLSQAFPFEQDGGELGRQRVGAQLESVRRLRNRIAHHDNLLQVNVLKAVHNGMSILGKIDADYPSLAGATLGPLRSLAARRP